MIRVGSYEMKSESYKFWRGPKPPWFGKIMYTCHKSKFLSFADLIVCSIVAIPYEIMGWRYMRAVQWQVHVLDLFEPTSLAAQLDIS